MIIFFIKKKYVQHLKKQVELMCKFRTLLDQNLNYYLDK